MPDTLCLSKRGFNAKKIPCYTLTDGDDVAWKVEFHYDESLVDDIYLVVVQRQKENGGFKTVGTSWLSNTEEYNPNGKVAAYYAVQHGATIPESNPYSNDDV